jgi:hypothetical protein
VSEVGHAGVANSSATVNSILGFYRHPIDTKTDHGNDKFESTGWIEILVSGCPPSMKGT